MWDLVNIAYAKQNQPLLLGLATDDSHSYHQFGAAFSNAGRGWVMVQADSLRPRSLIRSMEEGKFYASTGVTLKRITRSNNLLEVEIEPSSGVHYTIEFIGAKITDTRSSVLRAVAGTRAGFNLTDEFLFVRARITSDRLKPNPYQEGEFEMAWTQPVSLR